MIEGMQRVTDAVSLSNHL